VKPIECLRIQVGEPILGKNGKKKGRGNRTKKEKSTPARRKKKNNTVISQKLGKGDIKNKEKREKKGNKEKYFMNQGGAMTL